MNAEQPAIKFAVIGMGLMGKRHAEIIRCTPGAELAAVHDSRLQTKDFGNILYASDYKEILSAPKIDAVVICLPSGLHAQFGVQAAQYRKHVITEKPIDISMNSATLLVKACEEFKVQCHVISQNRFSEAMTGLKQALTNGIFGKIFLVEASVKWYRHDEYYTESGWRGRVSGEGGGVIMNQAIHTIDLLIWLLGKPILVEAMTAGNRKPIMETEDVAVASLKFADGALGVFSASTSTYPGFKESIALYGEHGSCVIEQGEITFWSLKDGSEFENTAFFPPPVPPDLNSKYCLFQRQYLNIIDSIRGVAAPVVTIEEALATLEIARKFYK